ncbi:protein transport Sec13-like protein [Encephalitozoon romaleae SJ-2008]|uniref:Protein transport Sec13-like protein n=1 Tax=Encephalitozoon romaleae (strain SJ-2008) TaxID=1178016 RepID=I7AH31_ENCRO|nr:protein transport Sec13-like protein [Encephalitozoon romaleae SJ-2008]AFN84115.1 protein transport Sec13-like protein [Encephalitozoon romaleae SJ-2008]
MLPKYLLFVFRNMEAPMDIHKDAIHSIETDFSQKRILTSCSDGMVRIFSKGTAESPHDLALELELNGNSGPATKAIFLNQGEFIASSYFNGKVIIWKYEGGRFNKKYEKQLLNGSVNDIAGRWDGDSFTLFCGCSDGNVRILTVDSSFSATESEVFCHRFGVSSVSAMENGFVSGGMDYSVAVWEGNEEVARFRDHKGFVRNVAVCPTNSFKLLCIATCSEDGSVIIYTRKGSEYKSQKIILEEPCYSLSWSFSGFSLSVGYGSSKFKCFVPDSNGEFKEVKLKKVES